MKPLCIALLGNTGVGKSTFVKILKNNFKNTKLKELRLATPLYQAQSYIYRICNVKKAKLTQDGVLLNFLGHHMRSINSKIMEEYFASQLKKISPQTQIIICSDARPLDIDFIKKYNFKIIKIESNPEISLERRIKRGDVSLANSNHSTEKSTLDFKPDYLITNNHSLLEYKNSIINLINGLYDFNR